MIAPSEWRIDYRVVEEDEPCTDKHFRAHHIHALNSDTPEDLGSIGSYQLGTDRTAALDGTRIFDSSEDGELFGGDPPQFASAKGIEWARVGEERRGGWKGLNFLPAARKLGTVLRGRRGRFFLRTYESGVTCVADSTAFRYWPELRRIKVDGEDFGPNSVLLPGSEGHKPASINLVGMNGPLTPELRSNHARLDGGSVVVEPRPEADEVRLVLRDRQDSSEHMNVVVNLPRLWWRLGATGRWTDRPIQLSRTDFRRSREKLTVLVPPCIKDLRVGLEEEARPFPASYVKDTRTSKQVEITLDEFADQLGERREKDLALRVYLPEGAATAVEVLPDGVGPPLPMEPISTSASAPSVFRGVIVRRKVFGGVVLQANLDGVVRIVWGKKRRKRVIQQLLPMPRRGNTIPQRVVGIFYKTKVVLYPAVAGTGLSAPNPVKAILELCGVRDARATTFGPNDPLNLIRATVDGLTRLEGEARRRSRPPGQPR